MCRIKQMNESNEETARNSRLFDFLTICGIGRYDEEVVNISSQQTPEKEEPGVPKSKVTEKMEGTGVMK